MRLYHRFLAWASIRAPSGPTIDAAALRDALLALALVLAAMTLCGWLCG